MNYLCPPPGLCSPARLCPLAGFCPPAGLSPSAGLSSSGGHSPPACLSPPAGFSPPAGLRPSVDLHDLKFMFRVSVLLQVGDTGTHLSVHHCCQLVLYTGLGIIAVGILVTTTGNCETQKKRVNLILLCNLMD